MTKFPQVNVQLADSDAQLTRRLIRPGNVGALNSPGIGLKMENIAWMDFNAWHDHVSKWKVTGPVPIRLDVIRNGDIVYITISARAIDTRNPDATIDIGVDIMVPTMRPNEATNDWLRAIIRWLVCHELDEQILIDGERVYDPHRPGLPAPTPENS